MINPYESPTTPDIFSSHSRERAGSQLILATGMICMGAGITMNVLHARSNVDNTLNVEIQETSTQIEIEEKPNQG